MAELHHGGRLREAAYHYGIALEQWLDLSTGINPNGWPVPDLPAGCWQRLPEEHDGLERVAGYYYGSSSMLPVAGTQAAIQVLPQLRRTGRVGLLATSYAEHARAWQQAGHEVITLCVDEIGQQLPSLDVLLLVNPNNPSGERFSSGQLLQWHKQLQQAGGWLIVDEAFIDTEPEQSLVKHSGAEGLVVLRSLGKFFGLAGIRLGFVFAWPSLLRQMAEVLGPWHVSGPAREVARLALGDRHWQRSTRIQLIKNGQRLADLLSEMGLSPSGGTALFQYVQTADAKQLHRSLAEQGIFSRLFSEPAALRFGLPANEDEWQRLHQALHYSSGLKQKRAV